MMPRLKIEWSKTYSAKKKDNLLVGSENINKYKFIPTYEQDVRLQKIFPNLHLIVKKLALGVPASYELDIGLGVRSTMANGA